MAARLDDIGLRIRDDFGRSILDDLADTTRFLTDQADAALTDEGGGGLVVDIFASDRLLTDHAGGPYKVPLTTEAGAAELTDESGADLIGQGETTLIDDADSVVLTAEDCVELE